MAMSSMKVALVYGSSSSSMAQISAGSGQDVETLCIKDVPDLATSGDKDQIETTTLCDEMHTYIDGLTNLPEELTFTANYSPALFEQIKTLHDAQDDDGYYFGIMIGDTSGSNGKFIFKAKIDVNLSGFGVGEVINMSVVLKPTSEIEFSAS